jgi:hypothetical protein
MSTATPSPRPAQAASHPVAGVPVAAHANAAPPAKPAPAPEAEGEEEYVESGSRLVDFNMLASGLISGAVHFIVVLLMALLFIETKKDTSVTTVVAKAAEVVEDIENEIIEEKIQMNLNVTDVSAVTSNEIASAALQDVVDTLDTSVNPTTDVDAAAIQVELSDFGERTAPKNDLMASVGAVTGSGLSGRGAAARGAMVKAAGGNDASEAAVAAALEWFANHQSADGGWNFDHREGGSCAGKCSEPGKLNACRTGATAMALLPFLGAGQTHVDGKYKATVKRGLYFLTSQMKVNGNMGDLAQGGGSMYSHGLSSIVLCEAYAMTHDKALMAPAQMSLNHIVYAQDPVGGGWRYQPRQAGDTSAVGWQLMALKSGHLAYLQVPPRTIQGAVKFLDSVQIESGAKYGYTGPGAGQATTAVGLLCRMYLGWKKDHPGIERGVEYISKTGPSKSNMYYNYYATQVMRHYEGEKWDQWNKVMRDFLVESQEKNGHAKGSWHFKGDHGAESGGRIYVTSMATMVLEVYYRHMPIYGKAAAQDEFPL